MSNTKIIGFATEFYTLWNVAEQPVFRELNGKYTQVGTNWNYTYMRNLSIDEDKAIAKAMQMYPNEGEIHIDDSLRGVTSRKFTRYEQRAMSPDVFPFGRWMGVCIANCDDVYQLERVLFYQGAIGGRSEYGTSIAARRKVLARRRLIELGQLIRFDHVGSRWNDATDQWDPTQLKYISKHDNDKRLEAIARAQMAPTHLDGEKVELMLTLVKVARYESAYGYVTIATYNDEKGMIYTYKGSSKPDIAMEVFTKVRATIKNSEYNGVKQVLIQRVKVLG